VPVARPALRELAASVAARHGVDPGLVLAVIAVESAFHPSAVSPKGARGLMQLMPATAAELGVSDAFDPEQNLDGGVRHLRELLRRYQGDLTRTLAAYNAGAASVERHGGVPPWPETRDYVAAVLRRYHEGGG
jgi:soluble lytic murein transglycosylase-like protein